ncbi:MAG: hypothetical protein QME81_06100 [bacterium]|nr:hypothetical protein [bacterium]
MNETNQSYLIILFGIGNVIAWGGLAIAYYLDHRKNLSEKENE